MANFSTPCKLRSRILWSHKVQAALSYVPYPFMQIFTLAESLGGYESLVELP